MANWSAEFIVKGKDRMQIDEFDLWGYVNPLLLLKWYAWIGAAVFFWGWIHQERCHAILVSFMCICFMFQLVAIFKKFSNLTVEITIKRIFKLMYIKVGGYQALCPFKRIYSNCEVSFVTILNLEK